MQINRTNHRLKTVPMAHGYPLQADLTSDHISEGGLQTRSGKNADHRDRPPGSHAPKRLWQSFFAPQFNNEVIATPLGDFSRRLGPFGVLPVIDRLMRTQPAHPFHSRIARRNYRDMGSKQSGKLNRKKCDSATSLN